MKLFYYQKTLIGAFCVFVLSTLFVLYHMTHQETLIKQAQHTQIEAQRRTNAIAVATAREQMLAFLKDKGLVVAKTQTALIDKITLLLKKNHLKEINLSVVNSETMVLANGQTLHIVLMQLKGTHVHPKRFTQFLRSLLSGTEALVLIDHIHITKNTSQTLDIDLQMKGCQLSIPA